MPAADTASPELSTETSTVLMRNGTAHRRHEKEDWCQEDGYTRIDADVLEDPSSVECASPGHPGQKSDQKRKLNQVSDNSPLKNETSAPSGFHTADIEPKEKRLRYVLQERPSTVKGYNPAGGNHPLVTTYHGLPVHVWQKVLGFVPPIFLGRIIRVSRFFSSLLDRCPRTSSPDLSAADGDSEGIWKASRRRFAPGLPKNLIGHSELQMWRLLRGSNCQLCNIKYPSRTSIDIADPWRPVAKSKETVRVIWPFGLRLCRNCLQNASEQERVLLVSSGFPSFLLPALPVVFATQHGDYVSSDIIRRQNCPADVQIHKLYYKAHIDEMQNRFAATKELGVGSTEEWVKGLENEGLERASRIHTWEQWEAKGGLQKVNARRGPKGPHVDTNFSGRNRGQSNNPISLLPPASSTPISKRECSSVVTQVGAGLGESSISSQEIGPPNSYPANDHTVQKNGLPQRPSPQLLTQRHERSLRDVNEAKALRRAEIEKRCAALEPPITPNLLRHMDSFQAALQISTTLTDRAWEVLKPRLIAQRQSAEEFEHEWSLQVRVIEVQAENFKQHENDLQQASESPYQISDIMQTPLRDRLSKYADEIIQRQWAEGRVVTKENCSKFAVDVLLYVRRRFYEDISSSPRSKSVSSPGDGASGPQDNLHEKLILEHMKWVFDNKIKALTEHFQRELFLCNACDGNSKFYGFEAVIQHYAAKHTTSLSQGSVVVHWRAEWPDPPPFSTNPTTVNTAFYAVPTPTLAPLSHAFVVPSPGSAQACSTSPYSATANLPSNTYTGYDGGVQAAPTYHHTSRQFMQHQQPTGAYSAPYFDSGSAHYAPVQSPPYPYMGGPVTQASHHNQTASYQTAYPQFMPVPGSHRYELSPQLTTPAASTQLYQIQKEEMAKQARDIWFATSGIKDIPQSVRIFVVIQHVVARFEQKYTNEPGLSMFIDGLDSSALMRPVRSLNGLACKTCVASGSSKRSDLADSSTFSAPSDRKLYTLPHLLNHFRTSHLEKSQPTVNLHTGMEAAPLDWKKDMIELPEPQLIRSLIGASGMTDSKLRLIAAVLPGMFLEPLPAIGAGRTSGPIPKYGAGEEGSQGTRSKRRTTFSSKLSNSVKHDLSADESASPKLWSSAALSRQSSSVDGNYDSIGDDEYDPRRPAYLGHIVEHHQVSHPLPRNSSTLEGHIHTDGNLKSSTSTNGQASQGSIAASSHNNGPYGTQLLRHHDRSTQRYEGIALDRLPTRTATVAPHSKDRGTAESSERIMADNFLRDLNPSLSANTYGHRPEYVVPPAEPHALPRGHSRPRMDIPQQSSNYLRQASQGVQAPELFSNEIPRSAGSRYIDGDVEQTETSHTQYIYADNAREPKSHGSEIVPDTPYPYTPRDFGATYSRVQRADMDEQMYTQGPTSPYISQSRKTYQAGAVQDLTYHKDVRHQSTMRAEHQLPRYSHESRQMQRHDRGEDLRASQMEYLDIPSEDYRYVVRYEHLDHENPVVFMREREARRSSRIIQDNEPLPRKVVLHGSEQQSQAYRVYD